MECIAADFNDDGYADLVLANSAHNPPSVDPGSHVYLNGPGGLPEEPSLTLPGRMAHGVACADLDGDGYLDLVFGGCRPLGDPYLPWLRGWIPSG